MSQPRTAVARIKALTVEPDGKTTVRFAHCCPHHEEIFWALLEKAAAQDYAIEIRLVEDAPTVSRQTRAKAPGKPADGVSEPAGGKAR